MPPQLKPIPTDRRNAFAHETMSLRVPGIIRETQQLNADYSPHIQSALDRLYDEVSGDRPMCMIAAPAIDYAGWVAAWAARQGQTWLHTDWFFAEIFFYRRMMECVRYFETGRDPFAPKKAAEYAGDALWHTLEEALSAQALPDTEQLRALLTFAVWGNRIDLSHALAAAQGARANNDEDLLVDDSPAIVELLLRQPGEIHIICDNAGTELAMDSALIDALLALGHRISLHVKVHPFFVSDTIPADLHHFWRLLEARGGDFQALSRRLVGAFERGALCIRPDFFWNSAQFLWEMPPYIVQALAEAALIVIKGDLNYRRAVGDTIWEPTLPFASIVDYLPAPAVTLRTMKSDPVIGLPAGMAEQLDAADPLWRINGKRGVIQARL